VQTLTEIVAAVVVHSSAVAYSHFGVTLEPHQAERPAVASEKSVARTAAPRPVAKPVQSKTSALNCPDRKASSTRA
jgi:hypothetical protein